MKIDWKRIHKQLGCRGCKWADPAQLDISAACTYFGNIGADDKGRCTSRKETP